MVTEIISELKMGLINFKVHSAKRPTHPPSSLVNTFMLCENNLQTFSVSYLLWLSQGKDCSFIRSLFYKADTQLCQIQYPSLYTALKPKIPLNKVQVLSYAEI